MWKAIAAMTLALALSGCGVYLRDGSEPASVRLARYVGLIEPAPVRPLAPLYCYSTLAEAECYAHSVPEDRNRLIAAHPPS